jgi:hypothetical protein
MNSGWLWDTCTPILMDYTIVYIVSVPHEQNIRHLNLLLFLVWCAPCLNTRQSPIVATQLHASEQRRRSSGGPALSV